MARLGPRIGKENEHAAEARIGQRFDDVPGIAHVDADIRAWGRLEFRQQLRYPVHIRLGADEADVRIVLCLPEEMLAAAEADFKPDVIDSAWKIAARITARFELQVELWQQEIKQPLLMRRKLRPLGAAVQHPAMTFGVIRHAEVRHAPRSTLTSEAALERVREISLFPAETARRIRLAAEMAIGRGARIDRSVEPQMLANAAWLEAHQVRQNGFEFRLIHFTGAVQIDID